MTVRSWIWTFSICSLIAIGVLYYMPRARAVVESTVVPEIVRDAVRDPVAVEGEQFLLRYVDAAGTNCGESRFFAQRTMGGNTFIFEVKNLVFNLQPASLDDVDTENGIDWKGEVYYGYSAQRALCLDDADACGFVGMVSGLPPTTSSGWTEWFGVDDPVRITAGILPAWDLKRTASGWQFIMDQQSGLLSKLHLKLQVPCDSTDDPAKLIRALSG